MEACGSAHYWARRFTQFGHEVRLLPPQYVRPYVPRDKTDRADAKAILEAHRNKDIHNVPVKTPIQQVLATHHRMRSAWMRRRISALNALRGILREHGVFIPLGAARVIPAVREILAMEDEQVPSALYAMLSDICCEIEELQERILNTEEELERLSKDDHRVKICRSVPGVGPLTSTAIVAFVGDVQRFASGRHFASYLGLTPRVRASGTRSHQGRISKRGDRYLRCLLVHGARTILQHAEKRQKTDRLHAWAVRSKDRLSYGKAVVALANKLARILWSVLHHDRPYTAFTP